MPTPTYTPLANITLGSAAASVTFSSISQTYRDLIVVAVNPTSSAGSTFIRFNGDSGTNYSEVAAYAGSVYSPGSFSETVNYINTGVANRGYQEATVNIMDYSATDKHKTALVRSGSDVAGSSTIIMEAARWANTAAITSVVATFSSGNLPAGYSIALYGVAA